MKIPRELEGVLVQSADTLSGAVRFAGTRVPVQALLDTLTHGLPVSDFLEGFPDVSAEQANAVVAWEQRETRPYLFLMLISSHRAVLRSKSMRHIIAKMM